MRVGLMTREYPPYVYGGAGVHVEYLSKELAKAIEVEVHAWGETPEAWSLGDPELPHAKNLQVFFNQPWPMISSGCSLAIADRTTCSTSAASRTFSVSTILSACFVIVREGGRSSNHRRYR